MAMKTAARAAASAMPGAARPAKWLDSRLIFAGLGIDADLVTLVDERRHLDDEPGLERRRLHLRARRRALDPWNRFLDDEIDCLWKLDTDRLRSVEFDADQHVGNQVILRLAQRFRRDVRLLVGRSVHEMETVAVAVQ